MIKLETDKISIIGASGHAKVVYSTICTIDSSIEIQLFDSDVKKVGKKIFNHLIENEEKFLRTKEEKFHIAIGNNQVRKVLYEKFNKNKNVYFSIIHPKCTVGLDAVISEGSFLAANAIVGPCATLGKGAIVNHSAIVDHDCIIGDWSHIAPHATLGGGVKIGKGVLIGAGAVILPEISVGDGAIIGAGSVVLQDVPNNKTYVGNPARCMIHRDSFNF